MVQPTQIDTTTELKDAVKDILAEISQEREKEIISRRFGLYDRKETLEQIGEMLGITRERVPARKGNSHPPSSRHRGQ